MTEMPPWVRPGTPFAEQIQALLNEAIDTTPDPGLSTTIEARKFTTYQAVSCCMLTDTTGVMYCAHPAPPRPSWAVRTRWRITSWWSGLRVRVGSWIAGVDLDRDDD